ncbi:helix-turn-helix domain-containing protein [Aureimonas frigidaquae]|uniref:Transcriptional regulator, AraC family n=1 Tax=Aureimonas frigidaquae TaxID=424757 RepID=A0A0P0Z1D1_9HYPH|nr:AraC family transcriptional regulator [Aureimonas frigidaquae]BAT27855.1 transcriptional regulator, AraC family [Aureimonas frigidaquae]
MGTVVEIRSYAGEVAHHRHAYHHIILPLRGRLEIETERRGGAVAGDLAAFVPAGAQHAFAAPGANAFLVLDLPADRLQADAPPFFPIGPDLRALMQLAAMRHRAAGAAPFRTRDGIDAFATLVLEAACLPAGAPDRVELALRRALHFMAQRLGEPIRSTDIARAAGLSVTRLHAAFRSRRDTTPHEALTALRLDKAEALLRDPALSIAEIAARCGLGDQSSATRIFRRARSTTPAAIRRAMRS